MAAPGLPRRATLAATMAAIAVVLAAGCSAAPAKPASPGRPAASHPAVARLAVGAPRTALAARYLAVAQAGNKRLEVDFDRLHEEDRMRLAAAHRDLREIAATERLFDRRLLGIPFPAANARIARFLNWVNQARAKMTMAAASSPSLARLHTDERRLTPANTPVEQAVTIIRRQLGLPPPETS
jgi:hypothetical protein